MTGGEAISLYRLYTYKIYLYINAYGGIYSRQA